MNRVRLGCGAQLLRWPSTFEGNVLTSDLKMEAVCCYETLAASSRTSPRRKSKEYCLYSLFSALVTDG